MNKRPRVIVAMSGGVDSSVAAAMLVKQGYQVIGMMLRLWSEPDNAYNNRCCTPEAMIMARRVAALLDIPFYAVDAQHIFYDSVVQSFVNGYARGITPNPCLICNQIIRWGYLYNQASSIEAQFLATGHYARLRMGEFGKLNLLRGIDPLKDQSYVLHILNQEDLSHSLFPLGDYKKSDVRQLAQELNLPVANRAESQDLCFLGSEDYRDFLTRRLPGVIKPGTIFSSNGGIIGEHQGLAFYTIGQRKGLKLCSSSPHYVLGKNIENNALIVGANEERGCQELLAINVHWISGEPPLGPIKSSIKVRYKATEAMGTINPLQNGRVQILFDSPVQDITPGQAAVFYNGEICLGGGTIEERCSEK
jgi:tRNA-specific 2-thiouridylase